MPIVDRFKTPAIIDRFAGPDIPPWVKPDQPIGHRVGMLTRSDGYLDRATMDRLQRDNPEMLRELLGREYSEAQTARDASLGEIIDARTGKVAANLIHGVKQAALGVGEAVGLAEPGAREVYTHRVSQDDKTFDVMARERPGASAAADLLGTAIVTGPLSLGPAGLTKQGFAWAAGTNAGISGLEFTPEGQSTAANMLLGGVAGAAGHGVTGLAGKSLNAAREATGNALARVSERLGRPPGNTINAMRSHVRDLKEQEIIERAAANGIPLTLGDVRPSPIALQLDAAMERAAFMGTAGLRREQAEKITTMLTNERNRFREQVQGPDDPPIDSAALAVKESMWREKNRHREIVGQLYDRVREAAGDSVLLTRNLSQTARNLLDEETRNIPNVDMQNSALTSLLSRYTRDTGLTFEGAREVRSRLKADIRAARANKVISTDEVRIANRLVTALEGDIQSFGREQGGRVLALLRQADAYYAQNVVPLSDKLTARMMNDADFDANLENWLRQPPRARRIYQATDDRGKAAMRMAMMDRAIDFATLSVHGKQIVSPSRFVQQVDNMQKSIGRVFTGQARKELDGLVQFLRHMEGVDRALGTAGRESSELVKTATAAGAGAIAGGAASGIADSGRLVKLATSLGILKTALSSKAGVRLLTAAADLKGDRRTGMSYLWDTMRSLAERQQLILDRQLSAQEDE